MLPKFRYYPAPVKNGSIIKSPTKCVCCKKVRSHVYRGPAYSDKDHFEKICPWCIADGSAHKKLGVEFFCRDSVGGNGDWDKVSASVVKEIAERTPSFSGWQQENWWTHCGDAAKYLGRAGKKELRKFGTDAVEAVRNYIKYDKDEEHALMNSLDKNGSPVAYIFKCTKCGKLGGYWDCD